MAFENKALYVVAGFNGGQRTNLIEKLDLKERNHWETLNLKVKENDNKTVNLIYDITLNKKAVIKKINFSGNKIFKSRLLASVIVTEESKFWKFLSRKKYLNERQIQLDQRLLKNFKAIGSVKPSDPTALPPIPLKAEHPPWED